MTLRPPRSIYHRSIDWCTSIVKTFIISFWKPFCWFESLWPVQCDVAIGSQTCSMKTFIFIKSHLCCIHVPVRHRSFVPQRLSYEIALNVQMRYRNEVAFVFLGDFHIKSHWCPNAMSPSGRSYVFWWLSYKVVFMSHSYPRAISQLGRSCAPRRLSYKVASMSKCDIAMRSHLCSTATFI